MGWVAVCLLFPVAGPVLYFIFGINRVKKLARSLRHPFLPALKGFERQKAMPGTVLNGTGVPSAYRGFFGIAQAVTRRPLVGANDVRMLIDGEEAYPAMLEAIDGARETVFLSSYIFRNDRAGREFLAALEAVSGRGVDARVLIDGFGEVYSLFRGARALRQRGIRVQKFLPPRIFPPSFLINLRNHRKILTVDGGTGFLGGMNIWDHHLVQEAGPREAARDLHFKITGPVVKQLEQAFLEDWYFAAGQYGSPGVPEYDGDPWERVSCRTIIDGPDENLDKLAMILNGAISAAQESIHIMVPYFIPSREMISALKLASLRGVSVFVILPEKNNLPLVHWASRNQLWELLESGVKVFYQPPPFNHSKLFVVDGRYSHVGSANMDPRSLRLNFEIAMEIYDGDFSRLLASHIESIMGLSRSVTLEEVDGRKFPEKVRDSLAWLASPYL